MRDDSDAADHDWTDADEPLQLLSRVVDDNGRTVRSIALLLGGAIAVGMTVGCVIAVLLLIGRMTGGFPDQTSMRWLAGSTGTVATSLALGAVGRHYRQSRENRRHQGKLTTSSSSPGRTGSSPRPQHSPRPPDQQGLS